MRNSSCRRTPKACPLARHQAASSERVTNRQHSPITLDAISRWLLTRLDGSADREELLDQLVEFILAEKIAMQIDGRVLQAHDAIRKHLQERLPPSLQQLARQALLIE